MQRLRALVASLGTACEFIRSLAGCMPVVTQLLASSNETDAVSAIEFLVAAVKFEVDGARAAARRMLPLVFAPAEKQATRDAVRQAIDDLYLSSRSSVPQAEEARLAPDHRIAVNLIELARGSNLGELSALEKVLDELVRPTAESPEPNLTTGVLDALFEECERAAASGARGAVEVARGAMNVLGMTAAARPDVVALHLDQLVRTGLQSRDGLLRRYSAVALKQLAPIVRAFFGGAAARAAPAPAAAVVGRGKKAAAAAAARDPATVAQETLTDDLLQAAFRALIQTVAAPEGFLDEAGWYSAAEASIACLYALHPAPYAVCEAALSAVSARVLRAEADEGGRRLVGTEALSRLVFTIGHVALQQLLHVESTARAVRQMRVDRDRRAADAQAEAAVRVTDKGAAAGGAKKKGGKKGPAEEAAAEDDDIGRRCRSRGEPTARAPHLTETWCTALQPPRSASAPPRPRTPSWTP